MESTLTAVQIPSQATEVSIENYAILTNKIFKLILNTHIFRRVIRVMRIEKEKRGKGGKEW